MARAPGAGAPRFEAYCIAYAHDIDHFLTFLSAHLGQRVGLKQLAALEARDIRAWLASRAGQFEASSNARALSTVKSFYRRLEQEGKVHNAAIFHIRGPRMKKALPKALAQDQTQTALAGIETLQDEAWLGKRDLALLVLIYGCGLRISEALSLTHGSRPAGDQLIITGKGNKQRMVPVLPIVRSAVEDYLAHCPHVFTAASPLFVGLRGKPLNPAISNCNCANFARASACPNPPRPRLPPQLRHPPALLRRRPALDPGTARPCEPIDHPALHPHRPRTPDGSLYQCPSARVSLLTNAALPIAMGWQPRKLRRCICAARAIAFLPSATGILAARSILLRGVEKRWWRWKSKREKISRAVLIPSHPTNNSASRARQVASVLMVKLLDLMTCTLVVYVLMSFGLPRGAGRYT